MDCTWYNALYVHTARLKVDGHVHGPDPDPCTYLDALYTEGVPDICSGYMFRIHVPGYTQDTVLIINRH